MKISKLVAVLNVGEAGGYDGLQGLPTHAGPVTFAVPVMVLLVVSEVLY
jgi:hypothetical protein